MSAATMPRRSSTADSRIVVHAASTQVAFSTVRAMGRSSNKQADTTEYKERDNTGAASS